MKVHLKAFEPFIGAFTNSVLKSKYQKNYGDPKKLSRFKNAGKPAFSQPNLNAATSLHRKKFIKLKL